MLFEEGDDTITKVAKVFATVAEVLFLVAFFTYCLTPVWLPFVSSKFN